MKYVFAIAALVMAFSFGGHAQAAVVCDYPNHPIWGTAEGVYATVGCTQDADYQRAIKEADARQNPANVVFFATGTTLNWLGQVLSCPAWFPLWMGCTVTK